VVKFSVHSIHKETRDSRGDLGKEREVTYTDSRCDGSRSMYCTSEIERAGDAFFTDNRHCPPLLLHIYFLDLWRSALSFQLSAPTMAERGMFLPVPCT
jgi:hypothetical protein